jgi:hypothetical protein
MLTEKSEKGTSYFSGRKTQRIVDGSKLAPHRAVGGALRGIRRRDAQSSLLCLEWATP